jgi:CRP-like cAMP-binding protein
MSTLARLAAHASRRQLEPGTVVIEEGTRGNDFFVIDDGRAEVLCEHASVRFMGAGECFGEIAALRRTSRTASVRAATRLRLLRLSGNDLVSAVTSCTPSRSEAEALLECRLATARTRYIALDVRVDGNEISGQAGDRPFRG